MGDNPTPVYERVLLKLSGEALMGDQGFGIDWEVLASIAEQIREIRELGVEVAVMTGGGNIFRGVAAAAKGMDRVAGDHMGMLATLVNCLALQDALEKTGLDTRLLSALEIHAVAEPFIRRRCLRHLQKGRIVLLAAGTGNPFFSTDTAAALRAMEIKADVILKATKVDGIFDSDPAVNPDAVKYPEIGYLDILQQGLRVMDSTAISLCMDHKLPIYVFNLKVKGNIRRAILGEDIGSLVT